MGGAGKVAKRELREGFCVPKQELRHEGGGRPLGTRGGGRA